VTWREGTKGKDVVALRHRTCVLAQDDLVDPSQREAVWLLMEWPHGEKAATDFTATTLPANMSRRQLVRRVKQRWRTERVYEDAKGELGLDHYEGRSFRGWNHHVSMVLVCFAFIVAERSRAFPPSAGKTARGKRRIVTTVRTATRPERHFRDSFITVAPGRRARPGHMVTPDAPCVTDRDRWDRLGAHAREPPTDDSLFESVVLGYSWRRGSRRFRGCAQPTTFHCQRASKSHGLCGLGRSAARSSCIPASQARRLRLDCLRLKYHGRPGHRTVESTASTSS